MTRRRRRLAGPSLALAVALVLGACTSSDEPELPEFSAPVVDAADVVADDVERSVSAELEAYQQRSGHQIAVAVVETTGGDSLEDYTIDLAREWGVGDEGEDDGVLLLIAYDDRRLRIEVGRGVEDELTDLESGRIIREQLTPRLRDGDVEGAIEAGTAAIRQALGDRGAVVPTTEPSERDERDGDGFGIPWPLLLFGLFALLGGAGRGFRRGRWGAAPFIFGALGGFGGFGRGGGGGGFGGFGGGGGGGFGGGGASGDW